LLDSSSAEIQDASADKKNPLQPGAALATTEAG
jgi:hypothetical protein